MRNCKKVLTSALIALSLIANPSYSQNDISGVWQGALEVAPQVKLNIQFTFTRTADGGYSAKVNSPDNPSIKDLDASEVSFSANKLHLAVVALSGSYDGTWQNGAISGIWSQPGSEIALNLKPYTRSELSQTEIEHLLGSWVGDLIAPDGRSFTLVFKFSRDEAGQLTGTLRNADGGDQEEEEPLADFAMVAGELEFSVPGEQAKFSGAVNGDIIAGTASQRATRMQLTLKRGEYVPPKAIISLSDAAKKQLEGEWFGEMKAPQGMIALVYKFETDTDGALKGSVSFPEMGGNGMDIRNMEETDGKVRFTIPAAAVEYSATLSEAGLDGTWRQNGMATPLVLKKGSYVPKVSLLDLSGQAMDTLSGNWLGKMENFEFVIRFETNAQGQHQGFFDVPERNRKNIRITEAAFVDGRLSAKIAIGVELDAKLSGNTFTGTWSQGGQTKPVTLTKN